MTTRKWSETSVLSSIDANQELLFLDQTQALKKDRIKRASMATLNTKILATALTGLSLVNSNITSADTILSGMGKLQGQLDNLTTSQVTEGSNLYFTSARALTAVGKTNNAAGWQITGGTTPATLVLTSECTIDQNLSSSSSVAFNGLTIPTGDFNSSYTLTERPTFTGPLVHSQLVDAIRFIKPIESGVSNVVFGSIKFGNIDPLLGGERGTMSLFLSPSWGAEPTEALRIHGGNPHEVEVFGDIMMNELAQTSITTPNQGFKLFANANDNGLPYVRDKSGNLHSLIAGVTDSKWESVSSTSYYRLKSSLNATGIRLYNLAQSQSVRISYESNGIYYDSTDPAIAHRFWQTLQAESSIQLNNLAGTLSASKGIGYYGGDASYRIGFDDTGGTGFFRVNVPTASSTYGMSVTAGTLASNNIIFSVNGTGAVSSVNTITSQFNGTAAGQLILSNTANTNRLIAGFVNSSSSGILRACNAAGTVTLPTTILADPLSISSSNLGSGSANWIATSIGGQSGDRVVAGLLFGKSTIGAHNSALASWASFYISSPGVHVGVGLDHVTQTANAGLHTGGSTILGAANSPISDANIYNAQTNVWLDETNTILNFKTKNSSGGLLYFGIQTRLRTRIITADSTSVVQDDIVFIDTTLGSVKLTVDVSNLIKPLVIVNYVGVGSCQFQAASGQFINGISLPIDLVNQWTSATIMPVNSTNAFIGAFSTG